MASEAEYCLLATDHWQLVTSAMSLDPTLYPPIPAVVGDTPRPFWSVIVPAYKSTFLAQALRSLIDQAPPREQMEILVINDSSPEDLEPIIREVGGDRVDYIKQPQNRGTYPTENAGVSLSRGQWIHILNDDDWVLPGFYEILQRSLAAQPATVGAAFTGVANYGPDGTERSTAVAQRTSPGILHNFIDALGVSNRLHPICAVFRRECFERLGGFNLSLNYCSDWEFNKRVALHYQWWYEPRILACYRMNEQSVSLQMVQTGQQLRDLKYAIELTERWLPPERREQITRASREHYAKYGLKVADRMLKNNALEVAVRQIQESLKLSRSPQVVEQLIKLLAAPYAGTLRQGVATFFERMELPPPNSPAQDHR